MIRDRDVVIKAARVSVIQRRVWLIGAPADIQKWKMSIECETGFLKIGDGKIATKLAEHAKSQMDLSSCLTIFRRSSATPPGPPVDLPAAAKTYIFHDFGLQARTSFTCLPDLSTIVQKIPRVFPLKWCFSRRIEASTNTCFAGLWLHMCPSVQSRRWRHSAKMHLSASLHHPSPDL